MQTIDKDEQNPFCKIEKTKTGRTACFFIQIVGHVAKNV